MVQIQAAAESILRIGRQGEHMALQVVFDLSDYINVYGDGVAELVCKRPGDDTPHPVDAERIGNTLVWTITETYTSVGRSSYGQCELRWYANDTVVKSKVWRTVVLPALDTPTGAVPPEPQQGWVDQVLAAGAEVKAMLSALATETLTFTYEDGTTAEMQVVVKTS